MIDGSPCVLALGFPGGIEWVIILLVVLIFFGNRIPGMARSLGSGITEFKSGLKEGQKDATADSGDGAASEKSADKEGS